MSSYTIANETFDVQELEKDYKSAKKEFDDFDWTDLDIIFKILLNNRDRFPGINLQSTNTCKHYINRWVKGYYDARKNPPSQRTANPKTSCTDPILRTIVKATQGMSEKEATDGEASHNLFMSAENIQGNLLEEYIALRIRPYGFIWCDGNVVLAVDFCNTDGSLLLQIKNKSNSENSSSSKIRTGTKIEKWYRLGTKTKSGIKIPDFKWGKLNELINQYKTEGSELPPCEMSEEDYQKFVLEKAKSNAHLITNK